MIGTPTRILTRFVGKGTRYKSYGRLDLIDLFYIVGENKMINYNNKYEVSALYNI